MECILRNEENVSLFNRKRHICFQYNLPLFFGAYLTPSSAPGITSKGIGEKNKLQNRSSKCFSIWNLQSSTNISFSSNWTYSCSNSDSSLPRLSLSSSKRISQTFRILGHRMNFRETRIHIWRSINIAWHSMDIFRGRHSSYTTLDSYSQLSRR